MAKVMNVAVIGLGRMGLGITRRLVAAGHRVTGFDLDATARAAAAELKAQVVERLADLPPAVQTPRVVWLMVPAGEAIDKILFDGPDALAPQLSKGDVVIDGGNSHYPDSQRRAQRLRRERGLPYLDCGTSGGVEGERIGYCLMLGGDRDAFKACEPVFAALAAPAGYAYLGPSGAGHYVKMIHNAIEYGVMQVLGEGFSVLSSSPLGLDLRAIAGLWSHGSVIRSWLVELVQAALTRPDHFERIAPQPGGGQTGTWAVEEAHRLRLAAPLIAGSLAERQKPSNEFAARIVAALRYEFGRHPLERKT